MDMSSKPEAAPTGATPTILQAIVIKQCVAATYNRGVVVLAPHVLFMKNDAVHVGAVTLERDGVVPKEYKLGVFKLDGLGEIAITDRPFQTSELWDPADERFADGALMTVER
ncbi:MAG: hypothetical protein E7773_11745 [Sphingomonas sp.]|uniref:hypothetical protein n=1 Tax=Sphingomonas sp. TaxID=28214 RepID=UPI00120BD33F|nr:hypothetical protein [Sphingomonas sp.]THD35125.1 MAG: hypothetical protein E7773_11745 [Sphingomonas sp.]